MPDIFQYSDYRKFLDDWYREKKKINSSVSHRMVAQQVGYKSAGYLSMIISGKTGMSLSMALKFAACMKLKKKETEYFQNMILFGDAKIHEEKLKYFEKMCSFKDAFVYTINPNQFRYYEKWYHSVIRALLEFFPFKDDYNEIANMLIPQITPCDVEESIALLKELNLIKTDENGYLRPADALISTGYDAHGFVLNNYMKNSLRLSEQAIDRFQRSERNFSCLTLGISTAGFLQIQNELREFRRKVMQIAEKDNAERIYQLGFQLFPISKEHKAGRTKR